MATNYRALAAQAARAYGLPVQIFLRQINQESGFNPRAGSSAGAQGIAQFMPATAKAHGVDPWNPRSALFGAAKMMAEMTRQYGSMARALSAYNSGRPDAYKDPNFASGQTYNYVRAILGGQDIHLPNAPQGQPRPGAAPSRQPSTVQDGTGGESPHRYTDFARGLIQASQSHSTEAMLGAIMQLRQSLVPKAQPISQPNYGHPTPAKPGNPLASPVGNYHNGMKPYQEMLAAQALAKKMGLSMQQNFDLPGGVQQVHVNNSYHYRRYPGDPKVGRATDVSGTPAQMAAYYRALSRTNPTELFYDPLGGMKYGKNIGAIGGHSDHVHIAY